MLCACVSQWGAIIINFYHSVISLLSYVNGQSSGIFIYTQPMFESILDNRLENKYRNFNLKHILR